MNETKNPTQEAFNRLYHQLVEERLQMKEGFTIAKEELILPVCAPASALSKNIACGAATEFSKKKFCFAAWEEKEELIPATPELLELEAFLANTKKNSKPVIEKSYREKFNELARPAMRWYPSWADFCATTTPTGSCCLRCGHPLGGRATGVCDECDETLRKEFKDSAPDFRFSEWD